MTKIFVIKHSISISLAIFVAILISYFYGFTHSFYVPLACFLACHAGYFAPRRQVLIIFVAIICALSLSYLLYAHSQFKYLPLIVILAIFISVAVWNKHWWAYTKENLPISFYFALVLLLTILTPSSSTTVLLDQILDVAIGCIIGLVFLSLIFPFRPSKNFGPALIPVLDAVIEACHAQLEFTKSNSKEMQVYDDHSIENLFNVQLNFYPEWVFTTGFNPGLRGGYRFFLIKLEQLLELITIMKNVQVGSAWPRKPDLSKALATCMQNNIELLTVLKQYFSNQAFEIPSGDFTSDIVKLEKVLHPYIPSNLELLDLSPMNVNIITYTRALKDMRQLLLQLVMALPAAKPSLRAPKGRGNPGFY